MSNWKGQVMEKSMAPHYHWGEHGDSWVLHQTDFLSVKREEMPPGTNEVLHYHTAAQQFFYVLNGEAVLLLDKETFVLRREQGISVPAQTKHFIANKSGEPVSFLVISAPPADKDRINIPQTT